MQVQGTYGKELNKRLNDSYRFISEETILQMAGVAVMGIEKIDFMWYLKKISWLALIGFAAGIAVFLLQLLLGR